MHSSVIIPPLYQKVASVVASRVMLFHIPPAKWWSLESCYLAYLALHSISGPQVVSRVMYFAAYQAPHSRPWAPTNWWCLKSCYFAQLPQQALSPSKMSMLKLKVRHDLGSVCSTPNFGLCLGQCSHVQTKPFFCSEICLDMLACSFLLQLYV